VYTALMSKAYLDMVLEYMMFMLTIAHPRRVQRVHEEYMINHYGLLRQQAMV